MKDLVSKLTSYNLFNYLLPGAVFVVLAEDFTSYTFRQDELFVAFFAYYFIGLVISRVGSLIVEPGLQRVGFVQFAPYAEFVRRSKEDPKLELLSEANNTYRTLLSVFVSLGLLKLVDIALTAIGAKPAASQLILSAKDKLITRVHSSDRARHEWVCLR